jgi:uncharacterized protein (TIGR02246 family)
MKALQALFLLLNVSIYSDAFAANVSDEKLIRDVEKRWEEAWNRHDMKAGAALFTEDADFINVNGWYWKGRDEIEKNHAVLHAGMFKDSKFKALNTDIRFYTPEIALTHVKWEIGGDKNPDGTLREPREGLFTQVLIKTNGQWFISAWHNTNILLSAAPASQNTNLPTNN